MDETLLVSNFFTLRGYLSETTGVEGKKQSKVSQGFTASVLGNAMQDLKDMLDQQTSWIHKNCENQVGFTALNSIADLVQVTNYRAFAENCARQFDKSLDDIVRSATPDANEPATVHNDAPLEVQIASVSHDPADLSDQELIGAAMKQQAGIDVVLDRVRPLCPCAFWKWNFF